MPALVTLYTRKGCCLCDDARQILNELRRQAAFDYEEIDIDTDAQLRQLYNDEVPVVAIDGLKVFQYHIDRQAFLKRIQP